MLSPIFSFIGPDSATHMSEELRDASKSLPRAMIATAIVNGAMGFVMLCTFCMLVGDVDAILASPTGQPFIQVFYNATGSKAGASAMTSIMIVMATFGCVTNIATSSRQIWAFARDRGLPFSGWLAHVGDQLLLVESWLGLLVYVATNCSIGPAWLGYPAELRHGRTIKSQRTCRMFTELLH